MASGAVVVSVCGIISSTVVTKSDRLLLQNGVFGVATFDHVHRVCGICSGIENTHTHTHREPPTS